VRKQEPGLRASVLPHPGGPAPNGGLFGVEQWQHKDAIKIANKIDFALRFPQDFLHEEDPVTLAAHL
jgi:hypothetical protein